MVELDPLDQDDNKLLYDLLEKHVAYTGSTVAKFILSDFENQLHHFIKVFPSDYKKVLQATRNSYPVTRNS